MWQTPRACVQNEAVKSNSATTMLLKSLFFCVLASTIHTQVSADEPPNKLNLCSKTPQTQVRPVDKAVREAVKRDDAKQLSSALKSGVDPNGTDDEGFTLLDIAITENSDKALDVLLRAGADVNLPFMGSSPLSLVSSSNRAGRPADVERSAKLKRHGAVPSDFDIAFAEFVQWGKGSWANALIDALHRDDMNRLAVIMRAKYDVNEPIKDGITSLHFAALEGSAQAVRYMIGCGANVNARTLKGAPVLWFGKDNPEVVLALRAAGATDN